MHVNFKPDEDQQLMLDALNELLDREATEAYITKCDNEHRQMLELRQKLSEAGFLSLGYGEEFGGTPASTTTIMLIVEAIARRGINMAYGLDVIAVRDILEFGNDEQRAAVLAEMSKGEEPFALNITEPGAGSDNSGMKTTAVTKDGMVTINGTKTLITNATTAKYQLVMAVDQDAVDPRHNVSMYLVPSDTPGITMDRLTKVGWHTVDSCEVHFDNVVVP